jgi:hypothetical protein
MYSKMSQTLKSIVAVMIFFCVLHYALQTVGLFLSLYGNVCKVFSLHGWNMEIGWLSKDAEGLVGIFLDVFEE